MKLSFLCVLLCPLLVLAQSVPNGPAGVPITEHAALLTWTAAPPTSDGPVTYNVYRTTGACPAVLPTNAIGMTALNTSPITGTTYTDVDPALTSNTTYCWFLASVSGTTVSAGFLTGTGTIPFFVPQVPTGTLGIALQ